jgi:hypothetical protein
LRGVAGLLEQPVTSFVESIATTLILKNFRKVLEAAAKFVETGYPTTKL